MHLTHQASPYQTSRHYMTSYHEASLKDNHKNIRAANIPTARGRHNRPSKEHRILLFPINRHLHWTLAIRCAPRSSTTDPSNKWIHLNLAQDEKAQKASFRRTQQVFLKSPACNPADSWEKWENKQGTTQANGIDCGVHLLLHAYVWLLHRDPQSFRWEGLHSPTTGEIFRAFIANSIRAGKVRNIWANPTFPPQPPPPEQSGRSTGRRNYQSQNRHNRRRQRRRLNPSTLQKAPRPKET